MRIAILSAVVGSCLAAGCDRGPQASPLTAAPAEPAGPVESIPNPQFAAWATFEPGTIVVLRSVTKADKDPSETVTLTTYKLVERSDDQLVVESQASTKRYDGLTIDNPPSSATFTKSLNLPPGMKANAKPAGVIEEGTESIRVGTIEYATRWHKTKDRNEGGEMLVQTWICDKVPGGLVKSITRTEAIGKTTTVEVVEVKRP